MARVKIPIVVIDANGNAVPGASVHVKLRSSGATAIAYQNETGGTTVPNPLSTDSMGRLTSWVDRGAYRAEITGSTIDPYVEAFEAAPASDDSIDEAWLADIARRIDLAFTATPGYTPQHSFNPEATTLTEVARLLATLIDAMKDAGLIQP